ncbi:uncharacterized protein LOC110663539 [Hevea brasiliensis]|uniref:uncharacterized protein LOC110663539 n=1 Tax=Hevea brasiliensis TaxID=3981 RepID=UPI0025EC352C|nr:uncharacterized protein LOC110663539 [Hevea brasiliensis]
MYKVVEDLTKIKAHLGITSKEARETSKEGAISFEKEEEVGSEKEEGEEEEEEEEEDGTENEEVESANEKTSSNGDDDASQGGSQRGSGGEKSEFGSDAAKELHTPIHIAPASKGDTMATEISKTLSDEPVKKKRKKMPANRPKPTRRSSKL